MFQNVFHINYLEQTLTEIASRYNEECSNDDIEKIEREGSSVGKLIILTLYLKNSEFHQAQFLSNPIQSCLSLQN